MQPSVVSHAMGRRLPVSCVSQRISASRQSSLPASLERAVALGQQGVQEGLVARRLLAAGGEVAGVTVAAKD